LTEFDVIVIGGGSAGLFTALNIKKDRRVLLIEKNDTPGKKLLISGSGRCNITHSGDVNAFFVHYGDNHRFLRNALKAFSNTDLIHFFKERGLNTTIDKNGKVFPSPGYAGAVLDLLISECKKNRVTLHCAEEVLEIEKRDTMFLVRTINSEYICTKLVISTGGKSYPLTGSTGAGYRFAETLGHTVIPPKPALTPVYSRDYPFAKLSGISLSNRTVSLYRGNKKINEHRGDIGFTHKGLSGPGILDFSRYIERGDTLKINLVDRSEENFKGDFISALETEGKRSLKRFLTRCDLPERLVLLILSKLNLDPGEKLSNVSKIARTGLIRSFTAYPFLIERVGGFDIAMVTRGGISLSEVSSRTMESKLHKNLFFAGEVLDIDGDTGGYNIQAAFSTGYLAALKING
jgi:predicted Rossmann fold flavoprotein